MIPTTSWRQSFCNTEEDSLPRRQLALSVSKDEAIRLHGLMLNRIVIVNSTPYFVGGASLEYPNQGSGKVDAVFTLVLIDPERLSEYELIYERGPDIKLS